MRYLHALFVLLLFTTLFLPGCDSPADAVHRGTLCLPSSEECPSQETLRRPVPGRNGLEYTLTSRTNEATSVLFQVTTTESLSLDRPRDEQNRLILYQRADSMGPQEILRERLGSYELTVAREIEIELRCLEGSCDLELEYLSLASQIECYDENQCGRGEFCEQVFGRCSECTRDSQCGPQQTCDLERGSCFPGGSRGCSTSKGAPLAPAFLLTILFLWVLSTRKRAGLTLFSLLLFAALPTTLLPLSAHAGSSASMSIGGGIRNLTGEVGEVTRLGWGIAVRQEIRRGQLGASFQLGSHAFTFRDETIPNELRLRGYTVSLGPRYYQTLPFRIGSLADSPVELIIGAEYALWGISENRRADLTGLDLTYHALGPSLTLSWNWNGILIQARNFYGEIFSWPGGVYTFDLSVGLGF